MSAAGGDRAVTESAATLARFIAEQTGHGAEVRDVHRVPGGLSYETWSVTATWQDGGGRHDRRLVMRKAPRGGVLEPYDASKEFHILKALGGTPVPVPRVLWLEPTGAVFGTAFYVMEFVDGAVPLPSDASFDTETRTEMCRQYTEALAVLHTLDWEAEGLALLLGVPPDAGDPAVMELDRCEETLRRVALPPNPVLQEAIAWLRERRPRAPRLSLDHGDYRLENFVWRDRRIVAVLDWERACIGDPMADVAVTRVGNPAGWWAIRGAAAQHYAERSGIAVDEARVDYYVVLEQLKTVLMGMTGIRAFAEGRTSDLRLVRFGRECLRGVDNLAKAIGMRQ